MTTNIPILIRLFVPGTSQDAADVKTEQEPFGSTEVKQEEKSDEEEEVEDDDEYAAQSLQPKRLHLAISRSIETEED